MLDDKDINTANTLDIAYQAFTLWRANKTSRQIPKHLWDLVFAALATHGTSVVAKKLKLSYAQIRAQQHQRQHKTAAIACDVSDQSEPSFVNVALAPKEHNQRYLPIKISMHCGHNIDCSLTFSELTQLLLGSSHATN